MKRTDAQELRVDVLFVIFVIVNKNMDMITSKKNKSNLDVRIDVRHTFLDAAASEIGMTPFLYSAPPNYDFLRTEI